MALVLVWVWSFLGAVVASAQVSTAPAQISMPALDMRFTNPQCKAYGDKPKNSFCTRDDLPRNQANPEGPFQQVVSLIRDRQNVKITLGTMTFSHKEIAAELCKVIRRGVRVEVLIDSGAEAATAEQVRACGGELFSIGVAEAEDEPRGDLHHNKFLLVERRNDSVLVFATANFSNPGLTINHETWGFVTDKKESPLMRHHQCLIESLKRYTDNLRRFGRDMSNCGINYPRNSKMEALFVPADSPKLLKLIEDEMRRSSRVLMTSNRYSFARITKAFGSSKATDRRAVFDDDLYWGGLQPIEGYEREAVDARSVSGLERTGVSVRFTQTSFGAAQKMHNKFIVLDNMVIVGAGNYTGGGLLKNFENFYIIRDRDTIAAFASQFDYLWSISSSRRQMPATYWDPGVRP
ncbi:hypothetical protein A11Q_341 [Pseudobdellovibrio exovorus JSS]|uniref:phospholipase D n=1 Tax=Pseudobdellovibrio exovorus JSS TaxID=1184267 RepID=M4V970_9BACT|nr:hypothetical protein A11Q_341 [Pseudobdellovibrio exovorus JSS]